MFLGQYQQRIDTKGRVRIPAPLLDEAPRPLAPLSWVLLPGRSTCLLLAPIDVFDAWLAGLGSTDDSTHRLMISKAETVSLDAVGRVALSRWLREKASIGSEVVITGAGRHIEIWGAEEWERFVSRFSSGGE